MLGSSYCVVFLYSSPFFCVLVLFIFNWSNNVSVSFVMPVSLTHLDVGDHRNVLLVGCVDGLVEVFSLSPSVLSKVSFMLRQEYGFTDSMIVCFCGCCNCCSSVF